MQRVGGDDEVREVLHRCRDDCGGEERSLRGVQERHRSEASQLEDHQLYRAQEAGGSRRQGDHGGGLQGAGQEGAEGNLQGRSQGHR